MTYPRAHNFLKWCGPAVGAGLLGVASLNERVGDRLSAFIDSTLAGRFGTEQYGLIGVVAIYMLALWWTGRSERSGLQGRPRLSTTNAAFFGLGTSNPKVIIDFKNFGDQPAVNVRFGALSGYFDAKPTAPFEFQTRGTCELLEVGQENHVTLIQQGSPTLAQINSTQREDGRAFYVVIEFLYRGQDDRQLRHTTIYYIDPAGNKRTDRWMLNLKSQQDA